MPDTILTEQRGDVLLITLNRPEKLNAWNRQMVLVGQASGTQADEWERVELNCDVGRTFARGRCVGTAMIDAILDWSNASDLALSVKGMNVHAVALCERAGLAISDEPADPGERIMTK